MWLLSIWNVTRATEELFLIFFNFNLNTCMCLVATILTAQMLDRLTLTWTIYTEFAISIMSLLNESRTSNLTLKNTVFPFTELLCSIPQVIFTTSSEKKGQALCFLPISYMIQIGEEGGKMIHPTKDLSHAQWFSVHIPKHMTKRNSCTCTHMWGDKYENVLLKPCF